MMGRLKALTPPDLDPEQRALLDAIITGARASGRASKDFFLDDGALRGPFNAWLHAPDLGHPAQRLGEAVRFGTRLPPKLRELAILTAAAHWWADYEWCAHSRIAATAGLGERVIAAVKNGEPSAAADPPERVVHRFAVELLETKRVSEETYRAAVALLGDAGAVELVTLLGYYALVSMVLNAFEVPLPEGEAPPFGAGS